MQFPVSRTSLASSLARFAAIAALAVSAASPAWSWGAHSLLTRAALSAEPGMGTAVEAEELEAFLEAERDGLAALLARIENRAEAETGAYAGMPPALAFDPTLRGAALRESFLRAVRVNPRVPLSLFRQPARGEAPTGRPALRPEDYSLIGSELAGAPMEALEPGASISALDVVATASDEPDYGLDVGLYADNAGPLGSAYGFGQQPFGNPALSYGSQAPFHMAFANEDPVIALAAPFSTRSQAAYREIQYSSLARFAFETGHPYWGWRFAGWALHYSEDLGEPYHARMIPGQGTLETMILNVFGSEGAKDGVLVLLSNRHLVVETYAYQALKDPGCPSLDVFEAALAGTDGKSPAAPAYRRSWMYDVAAAEAYSAGPSLDRIVAKSFPARYVDDPSFDFGLAKEQGRDSWEPYGGTVDEAARARLDAAIAERYRAIGAQTRAYAAYMRDPTAPLAKRRTPFDPRGAGYIAAIVAIAAAIAFLVAKGRAKRRARR